MLRSARTANGNGKAACLSNFLFPLPQVVAAAFMKNRLRKPYLPAGERAPER